MQIDLPMLTYYHGPRLVAADVVAAIRSYREAVRVCWQLRTRRHLTQRALAEEAALYATHLSDYLSECDNKRELPARHIVAFENACGNRVITQWLASQAKVTILEQYIARAVA